MPIKEPSEIDRKEIGRLVEEILNTKKQNPSTDTTYLENQIDQLVYQIYKYNSEKVKKTT
ncbi:MAG: hypothetical protein WD398_01180 [Cyclobacteriaceae bacterium]